MQVGIVNVSGINLALKSSHRLRTVVDQRHPKHRNKSKSDRLNKISETNVFNLQPILLRLIHFKDWGDLI